MLKVSIDNNRVRIGERFTVSFQRTLRIPDDGKVYPLPPGLGAFPIHRVEDYLDRVPDSWSEEGGVFIPMYQREALWLGFGGASWKPNAVKVGVGKVNAISGDEWDEKLHEDPQDYVVCPDQPWLDGINAGDGFIRQFVAIPLGLGYTVEAQVTGKEEFGGIQILVYEPKPGRFPDQPPPERDKTLHRLSMPAAVSQMGLGAGGQMRQKIYPDPYGIDAWDVNNFGHIFVHIINSEQYRDLTALEPPPTPISAKIYTEFGLPWFDLYDEAKSDITASKKLTKVRTIREKDIEKGVSSGKDDTSINVSESQIKKLRHSKKRKK
ncbi:MAG: hypothetical protein ACREOB_09430 [Thermodesulfobacteriota bacterium]